MNDPTSQPVDQVDPVEQAGRSRPRLDHVLDSLNDQVAATQSDQAVEPSPWDTVAAAIESAERSDNRAGRDLREQIQHARAGRGRWLQTDLAGNPIDDDHTWQEID